MHRHRVLVMLGAAITLIALAVPATAFGVLQNEYGMKYSGREACVVCHAPADYENTSHSDFAKRGAYPDDDYMWPAGRATGGLIVQKDDVAFSLGGGSGEVEYLVNNPAYGNSSTSVAYTELQGTNRYDTAVAASKNAFASAATVVVATGQAYPDALGGSALAGAVNGPLLLTQSSSVPAQVIAEIRRLGATKIYVLGGTSAVSPAAFNQLDALGDAVRLSGTDRYGTGTAVANEVVRVLGGAYSGQALMATGANFPDALGCQSILYAKDMPLILVSPTGAFTLPTGVTSVKVVSTGGAVPASVDAALGAKFSAPRISGGNAYATAAAVADYGVSLGMKYDGVGIVTGQAFPDALSAGPAVGSKNGVILLTATAGLSPEASAKLNANKATIAKVTFMGGPAAVSVNTRNQVKAILLGVSVVGDPNPFIVAGFEWRVNEPESWIIGPEGIGTETYTCNGCHHLGFVAKDLKPTHGKFMAGSVNGAANAWVSNPASSTPKPADKLAAGASVQCEICHGTGEASPAVANHYGQFTSNVKILYGLEMLDSQLCGQCHGSWEGGAASNMRGYTPDQNILTFGDPYDLADVPTRDTWNGGKIPGTSTNWRFFPTGQNRSAKHVYYTEWAMSGHSARPQYTGGAVDPRETPYQKEIGTTFDAKTADVKCLQCHAGEAYAVRKGLGITKARGPVANPIPAFVPTNANSGFMGIECANCHLSHGSDEANGMGVRAPETAASLAGVTNTSICEDCHNWRLEALGLPLVTAPQPVDANGDPAEDLSVEGGLLYPNRELVNGVGMFEVANAGKFMPGVKCEECHMPATRADYPAETGLARYDTQSFKRYSHRMHIMEPADAKTWGLQRWADSCSPCHGGATVEQLQTKLNTWRADATAASVEASAAYAAAWTTAATGPEDPDSVAFSTLMGRAYYNYKTFANDGSNGAHNPAYIVEGLKAATKMAKSVNGSFGFLAWGDAFLGVDYITGKVLNGDGSPAVGAVIKFTIDSVPETVTTDANGNFTFLFADDAATFDEPVWQRCSDPAADLPLPLP